MWGQFFLEHFHFAVNILASLVFFAVFWLYFDAWLGNKKNRKSLPKIAGFLLLAISYLLASTILETILLSDYLFNTGFFVGFLITAKIFGYLLILASLFLEPIEDLPKNDVKQARLLIPGLTSSLNFFLPLLPFLTGIFYLRRARIGYETHLRPMATAFFILTLVELISLTSFFRDTNNVLLFKLVAPFGLLWFLECFLLFLAIVILGKWVWSYLLRRLMTQLFMIFALTSLLIFLITTISFSSLLLKNLENETFNRLETDAKVLNYFIQSKQIEALTDSELFAKDPQIKENLNKESLAKLAEVIESYLLNKKLSSLVVVDSSHKVLARGEDKEKTGDSLSDDPFLERLFSEGKAQTITVYDRAIAPEIYLRSGSVIRDKEKIIGAVLVGHLLDDAFLESLKKATNLEAAIYGGNILSASTMITAENQSSFLGIKETNETINQTVLNKGNVFKGSLMILNHSYFGAYLPLKDVNEGIVGMLFVGQKQVEVLKTAANSIELTFIIVAILLVFSILPSYLIARSIAGQVK